MQDTPASGSGIAGRRSAGSRPSLCPPLPPSHSSENEPRQPPARTSTNLHPGPWPVLNLPSRASVTNRAANNKPWQSGPVPLGFTGCSGTNNAITIPGTIAGLPVRAIGDVAFYGYTSLTSVSVPEGVTSIGNNSFYGCTGLTRFIIPNSVTYVGERAFRRCRSLTSVTIGQSVRSIHNHAFAECIGLTSVIIPDTVTFIGEEAFAQCYSLAGVTIGTGVTSIEVRTFYACENLTRVTIPDQVTAIGGMAFYACKSLTSVAIGKSVTSIADEAFRYCTSLTSITIPENITSIGTGAFDRCESLVSVTLPHSITSIGVGLFSNCTSLTSVTLPDSITSIGISAFYGCPGLTNVVLPSSVISIGYDAFRYCASLTSATFKGNAPSSFGSNVFSDSAPGFAIQYYEGSSGFTSPTWNGYPAVALSRPPQPTVELKVKSFTRTGETVTVTAGDGLRGWIYELQRIGNLDVIPWVTVATVPPLAVAGLVELTDTTASAPQALYRVVGHAP